MVTLVMLICQLLQIYSYLVLAWVLASWLVAFGVLNGGNRHVRKVLALLNRAVEPPMAWLRKILPPAGGIDFTPMVLLFGIYLAQKLLIGLLY